MFPARFEYQKATSVADAVQALSGNADAKIIAGGHSLIPLMKLRLARPSLVVDIGGIAELQGISVSNGTLNIGALTTHHQIATSSDVHASCEILAEAAAGVGDPAVRNRGTIGGNVSHADPASDLPTVLIAMGASFNITGSGGTRSVSAADFFQGAFTTALGDQEVLTGVSVPVLAANQVAEYAKMAHPATSYAIVGAAVLVTMDGEGDHHHCTGASIAVGGLVPSPVRSPSVEAALTGHHLTQASIEAAVETVANDLGSDIIGDIYASAEYRRAMAATEMKHALFHAIGLAHH